jgi:hypothetical protein
MIEEQENKIRNIKSTPFQISREDREKIKRYRSTINILKDQYETQREKDERRLDGFIRYEKNKYEKKRRELEANKIKKERLLENDLKKIKNKILEEKENLLATRSLLRKSKGG